jgi:transcriptional regulator with XRE-family HTH domain
MSTTKRIPFGHWIREQRGRKSLTIRALSERTRLDVGTISRLENLLTQPTLLSAVRLCQGLDCDIDHVLAAIDEVGPPIRTPDGSSIIKNSVLVSQDLELFLRIFRSHSTEAKGLLLNLLERVQKVYQRDTEVEHQARFPIKEEEVLVLVESSPLLSVELQYPPIDTLEFYEPIYRFGGVVILEDAQTYLRTFYRTYGFSPTARKTLSGVLSRLEETAYDRIKLADILALDKRLGAQGMIFSMYWYAYQFQDTAYQLVWQVLESPLSNQEPERYYRLTKLLVVICRWLQWLLPNDESWKNEFRKSFSKTVR